MEWKYLSQAIHGRKLYIPVWTCWGKFPAPLPLVQTYFNVSQMLILLVIGIISQIPYHPQWLQMQQRGTHFFSKSSYFPQNRQTTRQGKKSHSILPFFFFSWDNNHVTFLFITCPPLTDAKTQVQKPPT